MTETTPSLAPISSSWYLGHTVVLGVSEGSQTMHNLRRQGECVINLPEDRQHTAVERLAPLTGRDPVPEYKQDRFRFEARKFEAAGLTTIRSETVAAPRVRECPVQLEAVVEAVHAPQQAGFGIVETRVQRVHVLSELVVPDTDHVDVSRWNPLFYVFRHYVGSGPDHGRSFRAES